MPGAPAGGLTAAEVGVPVAGGAALAEEGTPDGDVVLLAEDEALSADAEPVGDVPVGEGPPAAGACAGDVSVAACGRAEAGSEPPVLDGA